jgi:glycosyltransferase involved in cell wall biosynthesis
MKILFTLHHYLHPEIGPGNCTLKLVIPHYPHSQLPNLLQDYQIKSFPSLIEGFGLVLIEAMACGLAPVTTYTSGPRDIITHGLDGILIPVGDAIAISQALSKLIENLDYLAKLRQNAYKTAQKLVSNCPRKSDFIPGG